MDFGDVPVGEQGKSDVSIINTNPVPIVVSQMRVAGQTFSTAGDGYPISIPAGGTRVMKVVFVPTSASDFLGQLTAVDPSAKPLAQIALHGRGGNRGSSQLAISSTTLNFGSISVNTVSLQSLTLTSTGTLPVTINSAAMVGNGFSLIGAHFPLTLNVNESVALQVQFAPSTIGSAVGQLDVNSTASNGNTARIVLNGMGVATSEAQLALSTTTLDFGSIALNTSKTQSLILTSTGNAPVTVNSANIVGAGYTIIGGVFPLTLNPTQSAILRVQFQPNSVSSATGRLTISSNTSVGSATVALSGAGIASRKSQLTVSPSAVTFGGVTANTTATQSVTLTSTGNSPVTVTGAAISGTGYTIVGAAFPMTLKPTQTTSLRVQFTPTAVGLAPGQLIVSSSSSDASTVAVALSGTGTAVSKPQLAVSTTSLAFGRVTVNTATIQSLTLTSTGNAPVTVNSASISGAGYTIIGTAFPVTIGPNQTASIQVQFKPVSVGSAAGRIAISSNALGGSTPTVTLSGTGSEATKPQLAINPTGLTFGDVPVSTATTRSITLTATGNAPVTVNSASISGSGYTIIGMPLPMILNPTQTATLQVQFSPASTGSLPGQLIVRSNASSSSLAAVALSGTGVAVTRPQLTISPTSVAFGNVTLGMAKTQSVTLTSTGTSPVTVSSAAISGTGYTIVGTAFPITLEPKQTARLQVTFAPVAPGGVNGQLTVASNTSSGTVTVALGGTGIVALNPQLSLSLQSLSFGNILVNTAATLSLILTSTGTSPVTVNTPTISGTGFTFVSQLPRMTLDPNQSTVLQIQFDPQSIGTSNGTLTISSDSIKGSTVVVALTGTAIATDPWLTVSPTNLNFGTMALNTATTLPLTLKSTGTTPVTVNSISISGSGYTLIGGTFPLTLNPAQIATLQVQLKPTAGGDAVGQITVLSNSLSGSVVVVALTGTGTTSGHEVDLTWDAPATSPSPVAGYNIYRSLGNGPFALLNAVPNVSTSYVDKTIASPNSYNYVVKSVDSSGSESIASNQIQLAIP